MIGNKLGLLINKAINTTCNAVGAAYYTLSTEAKGLKAGLAGMDLDMPINANQVAKRVVAKNNARGTKRR